MHPSLHSTGLDCTYACTPLSAAAAAILLAPTYSTHITPPRTLCPPPPVQHWQGAKREAQSCCQPCVAPFSPPRCLSALPCSPGGTGKELNARRSAKQVEAAAAPAPSTSAPAAPSSDRGEKFRAIKAREAAARAAKQVGAGCRLCIALLLLLPSCGLHLPHWHALFGWHRGSSAAVGATLRVASAAARLHWGRMHRTSTPAHAAWFAARLCTGVCWGCCCGSGAAPAGAGSKVPGFESKGGCSQGGAGSSVPLVLCGVRTVCSALA